MEDVWIAICGNTLMVTDDSAGMTLEVYNLTGIDFRSKGIPTGRTQEEQNRVDFGDGFQEA